MLNVRYCIKNSNLFGNSEIPIIHFQTDKFPFRSPSVIGIILQASGTKKSKSKSAGPATKTKKKSSAKKRSPSAKTAKKHVDILSPAAMENIYYISHNAVDCLEFRGFGWPGTSKKKSKKGKKQKSKK